MMMKPLRNPAEISITVFIQGEKRLIKTYQGEYRNLMMLLYDKFYLDDFGECKGIGRCGTCHIKVAGNSVDLRQRVGNENSTLSKMTSVTEQSRLACQMSIDYTLDGLELEIISNDE